MENSQDGSGKDKPSTYSYINKYITKLDELIYARAKLVCEKIGIPLKKHEEKIKTSMGISTGSADKKSGKTGQNYKAKERRLNM